MCQCGVRLRPNQSTMDRIRTALAALKTTSTVILSRGRNSGHNQKQVDNQKAMGAKQNAANTPLCWTDGKTTKHIEFLNWYTVGLKSVSSTSTTSPRLTSVTMHLTDSDYDLKTHSS